MALGLIVALGGKVIDGITGLLGKDRVGKKEFYSIRDSIYSQLRAHGIDIDAIPGRPFHQFGHSVIKDSPLKNYKGELQALYNTVQGLFPDLNIAASSASTSPSQIAQAKPVEILETAQKAALSALSVEPLPVSGAQSVAFTGGTIGDWTITKGHPPSKSLVWGIAGVIAAIVVAVSFFNTKRKR